MRRRKSSKQMPLEPSSDGNHVGAAGGRGSLPPAMVVGIGASSGALAPLRAILAGLSGGHGLAVVIVQHIGAQSDGLVSLISDQTPLQVVEAADGMVIGADQVYVVSPDRMLSVTDGRLSVKDVSQCQGLRMPIDHCFCTLATDAGRRAAGVVLSGIGMDGTAGLAEIKSLGGIAVAQDPATAEFPEMPGNAVTAGHPDAVLSPEAITAFLVQRAEELIAMTARQQEEAALEEVLAAVRNSTGHDFHCYKRGTLERRIRRRMALHHCGSYDEYARLLRTGREEAAAMRKDLLIGVTEFFRQVEAWRVLEEKVFSELVAAAKPQATLRVWVPACASGKEVYSLAMLLAEAIETSGKKLSLQIFATDADAAAVEQARAGRYTEDDLKGVSQTRLVRFFGRRNGRYEVIKQLRETIVFAPQDLTSDPPFSKLDLVSCRNLLIYLDQSVQKKIIQLFHFALREGGYLFLGSAENINGQENLFEPVSQKWRIYRKLGVATPIALDLPLQPVTKPAAAIPAVVQPRQTLPGITNQAIAEAFGPPAAVVVDRKGTLLYLHGEVGDYLKFTAGEHTGLLADAAREGLRNRLASAILRAAGENRKVTVQARVKKDRKTSTVKVTVQPLHHPRKADGLLLVTFEPQRLAKAARAAAEGDAPPPSDAQQLEDELRITREELSSTIEQLEHSNEHLKALNEEVMSANEELQAANEELETSKEELHSLNEELNAVNQRLQEKVAELEQNGNDVANLLTSGNVATIFLDRRFCVRRFTPAVTKLLSVIDSDLGRPITEIVRKFKDEALLDDVRRVLVELTPAVTEVRADDGEWYLRRILPYRTKEQRIEGVVVTFSDVTDLKELTEALQASEEAVRQSEQRYRELVQNAGSAIIRWTCEGKITFFNEYAQSFFGYSAEEAIGQHVSMLVPRQDSAGADLSMLAQDIVACPGRYVNNVNENICRDGRRVWMAWSNRPIYEAGGQVAEILAVGMDITERKKAEEALREREREFAATFERSAVGKSLADPATNRMLRVNQAFADMLGYSIEELRGKTFVEITHPEDRGRDLAAYDAVRTGRTDKWEIEKRYLRKDGSIMWAHVSGNIIRYDDDRPARTIAVIQDITERRAAEQALRESEQRLTGVLESMPDAFVSFDAGMRYTYVNANAELLQAARREELLGRDARVVYPDAESYKTISQYEQVIREQKPLILTSHHAGFDRWVETRAFPTPDGVSVFYKDVSAQIKAEQALRASEQKFRNLFENIEEMVTVYEVERDDNGRIVERRLLEANRAFLRAVGVSSLDEIRGKRSGELFGEAWSERHLHAVQQAMDTGRVQTQEVYRPESGRHYLTSVVRLDADTFLGTGWDITGLKRAEEAIRQSRQTFSELIQRAPFGIYVVDSQFRIAHMNASSQQGAFRNVRPIIGRDFAEAMHILWPEPVAAEIIGHFRHTLDTGKPYFSPRFINPRHDVVITESYEWELHRMTLPDGQYGVICYYFDSTKLREAEQALRRSEARWNAAIENFAEGVIIATEDEQVIYWNPAARAMHGFSRPDEFIEPLEKTPITFQLWTPDGSHLLELDEWPMRRIKRGETVRNLELLIRRPDQGWEKIFSYSGAMVDTGGGERLIFLTCHDLTKLRQVEQALRKREARLQELSENLAARNTELEAANQELESFIYSISHDLRAPVRHMTGFAGILLEDYQDRLDKQGKDYLQRIRTGADKMTHLIDDLLRLSRISRQEMVRIKVDLSGLAQTIIAELKESAPGRTITVSLAEGITVFADKGLMEIALSNLLENAWKFTAKTEEARIEFGVLECGSGNAGCAMNQPKHDAKSAIRNPQSEITYFVRDNGAGFDPQHQDKMFRPFQRLHSEKEFAGTGIGLAIVERIIHRHGGRIWAEGEVGKGATVYFTLK